MTIKGLADHYLRHWIAHAGDSMRLADNAPPELRVLVREMAPNYTPSEVFRAIESLATSKPVRVPALPGLLAWLATAYDSVSFCQAAFTNKRTPPKSFDDMLERAFKASQNAAVTRCHDFLSKQIASF